MYADDYYTGDYVDDPSGNYIARHWRGHLSLPISYWVNGVIITLCVGFAMSFVGDAIASSLNSIQLASIIMLLFLAIGLAVTIWSMVGIWRSADLHVYRGGASFWASAAKFMMFLGGLRILLQIGNLGAFTIETMQLATGNDSMGDPATVVVSGTDINVTGMLTLGTADKVSAILAAHPGIKTLILNSPGGRLGEATEIAELVMSRRLDTIATTQCNSACTMIFVAGVHRSIMANTGVGFHKPSYPGMSAADISNMEKVMQKTYSAAKIAPQFVARTMDASSDDMWFPKEAELFDAGVLTGFNEKRVIQDNLSSANELNQQTPKQLDDITALVKVTPNGKMLTMTYEVDRPTGSLSQSTVRNQLYPMLKKQVCSKDYISHMFAAGAQYQFVYNYRSGQGITSFMIDSC